MRPAEWPERDRLAFEHARRVTGIFDLPGPAASWAVSTFFMRQQTYGRYLNFLKRNQLLLANEGPADRVSRDRLTLYLTEIKQLLSPRSIQQALVDLRLMMKAIVPEKDWDWITRHPARPSVRDVRDDRETTRVFDPKEVCNRAMDVMDHIGTGAMKFAIRIEYRNALIVAIQCLFALRLRNLAMMTLGRNLIIDNDVIHVIFGADETKTRTPIRWTMAHFLKPYMLTYLEEHRPALLAGNISNSVWIDARHQAISLGAMSVMFGGAGSRLVGFPINCHRFRHSLATAILTNNPRDTLIASGALTHRSPSTVNKHYDMSGQDGSRNIWNKLRRDIIDGKRLRQ